MGIGFVILFWLVVFVVVAAIYISLHFLAKENDGAAAFKDAFLALFGVAFIAAACLVIFTIGSVCLDYLYPSRIFTKNFGFEPTADVRIIEGSSFWTPFGFSTHLRFQANEETVQKIVFDGFSERSGKDVYNFNSDEAREILAQPQSRHFHKSGSNDETLVYDRQSQNAYFYLVSFD